MSKDIAKYVKECQKCLLNKVRSSTREPMQLTPIPQRPFDCVVVDTIGPLQRSNFGNKYAVTMICDLTKYLIAVPIADKTAKSVARAIFEKFVLTHGPMKQICSDMGTEYRNEVLSKLCKLLKIEQKLTTAYHHQSVGSIERNHRVFNEYIRAFVQDMSEWDEYLHYFVFLHNTSKNSCFQEKFSPYELVFERIVNSIECIGKEVSPVYNTEDYAKEIKYRLQLTHERAKQLLQKSKLRNKEYYDRKIRPIEIKNGDMVLLKKEPYEKHAQIYTGPYIVKQIMDSNVKLLDKNSNKEHIVHKNRIVRA